MGYSPWDHRELATTEGLTLSQLIYNVVLASVSSKVIQLYVQSFLVRFFPVQGITEY